MPFAGRRAGFETMSGRLASLDDRELTTLLSGGIAGSVGVGGGSTVVTVDGVRLFAKRVPLTDRELAQPLSTANLFDLPVHCQYGVGGPGFGAWRELAANQIVTEGVLAGETSSFPLLYHWRVLPGRAPVAAEHEDVDAVVALMGGSPAVRVRLNALAAASSSLVLFLEHVPLGLAGWLGADPMGRAESVERQLGEIVAFLRSRDLLHLDVHMGNLLADGERVFLADFGLVTSPGFDLSAEELTFAARNATHDAGYASMTLVNWLVTRVTGLREPALRNEYVRACAAGQIPPDVPPPIARILAKHAATATTMNNFYWKVFGGKVITEFPGV
jgi:hypothetical protein